MKKIVKIIAIIIAIALIGGIIFVANAFVGNPISKAIATNSIKRYMAQNYSDTDFIIDKVSYSFKSGGYSAYVISPSSLDTHFNVSTSSSGKIQWDSFDESVTEKRNTLYRLDKEYRDMVDTVLNAENFPYKSDIEFGYIKEKYNMEANSIESDFGIDMNDLVLDKKYDMKELGAKHGGITFYTQDEDVSVKRASEILLDIKRILDYKNITFYAIQFVLEKPRNEDGTVNINKTSIHLIDFLYSDIYEDGLEERIQAAHEKTMNYFDEQDGNKQDEINKK